MKDWHLWNDLKANTGRDGPVWALFHFLFHPGFMAITLHRWAFKLRPHGFPGKLLSKIIWRINVILTGCHISPEAIIGRSLRLPHAGLIVIGGGVVIGSGVTILHNVTIGKKAPGDAAYPVIGDNAQIFAGASVFGPVRVGNNSTIAAHALVLSDVPEGKVAAGVPARMVASRLSA